MSIGSFLKTLTVGAVGVIVVSCTAIMGAGIWATNRVNNSTPEERQKFGETVGRKVYGAAAGAGDVVRGGVEGTIREGAERNPELAKKAEEAAKRAGQAVKEFEFPLLKQDSAPFVVPPADGTTATQQAAERKRLKDYVCKTFKSAQTRSEGFRSLGMSPDEKCEPPGP